MRSKLRQLAGLILIAGSLIIGSVSFADAANPLVKVGLQYGSVKDASQNIRSETGFNFGLYQDGSFLPLINFQTSKDFVLIKNGSSTNETLITTPSGSSPLVYGKYHIQIGAVQPTLEAIQPIFEMVKRSEPDAYLAYDGGWRIYSGAYFTEAEYNNSYNNLMAKLMPYDLTKAPFNYSAFMVLENNSVKLLFATSDTDFGFESFQAGSTISFNKYKYRGGLVFKRYQTSDPTVINYIPVEQYLYGVLPYEISPKWPIEAQKAQAVAARNYAMTNLNKHKKHGFDVCNTIDCQVYAGANVETPLSNSAVDLTKGIYLKYNGKLVNTVYHSNSGGRTENSENIWTSAVPYLVGVDDPYSIGLPNDKWSVSFTAEQLKQKLAVKKVDIGDIIDVNVDSYSSNGRAMKTTFIGTKGKVSYDKDRIRGVFLDTEVKTNYFTISKPGSGFQTQSANGTSSFSGSTLFIQSADASSQVSVAAAPIVTDGSTSTTLQVGGSMYTFNGKGWGHGVGMSQWGSKKMAELGFTYEDILKHYFQNTYLEDTNLIN